MKALRQGDVLVRPTSEQFVAETSGIDWTTLRVIVDDQLHHLQNIKPANRDATAYAVKALYAALQRPLPHVHWHDGTPLEPDEAGVPLRVVDKILHNLWFNIPNIEQIVSRIGYDPHTNVFRITSNKPLLSNDFRLRGRTGTRPPWSRDLTNMISQFDAPVVALYDFAVASGISMSGTVRRIAEAIKQVLDETFAVVLFEGACVLIDRPLAISLDATNMLSATSLDPVTGKVRWMPCPAYESRSGHRIFAVNGVTLAPSFFDIKLNGKPTEISWNVISSISSPRIRAALIGYIGWERFLEMAPRNRRTLVDRSKYGELFVIICDLQQITVVQVVNSTPEPDGSHRKYVIPVDGMCRPLPNPADPRAMMGDPQARTALNAVASTFGMTGEQYKNMLGAES